MLGPTESTVQREKINSKDRTICAITGQGRESPISLRGSGKVPGHQNIVLKGAWGPAKEGGVLLPKCRQSVLTEGPHTAGFPYRWAMDIQR